MTACNAESNTTEGDNMPTFPDEVTVGPTTYRQHDSVAFVTGFYGNGRPAVALVCLDGSRDAVATVNLPDENLEDDHVFLKGWSENDGLPAALEAAGGVKLTGRRVSTGHAEAEEGRLLLRVPGA